MNGEKRGWWKGQYCILLLCLLFVPSCLKKKLQVQTGKEGDGSKKIVTCQLARQQEAMLVDIPLPLYDERIITESNGQTESETLVLGYKSPLSKPEAIDFFMHQMERYGWQNSVCFDGFQALLQFESPDRYCTVSIKEQEPRGSCIFIYIKRASTSARP